MLKRGILRGMLERWDLGLGSRTFGTSKTRVSSVTYGNSESSGTLGQSKFIATAISLISF